MNNGYYFNNKTSCEEQKTTEGIKHLLEPDGKDFHEQNVLMTA